MSSFDRFPLYSQKDSKILDEISARASYATTKVRDHVIKNLWPRISENTAAGVEIERALGMLKTDIHLLYRYIKDSKSPGYVEDPSVHTYDYFKNWTLNDVKELYKVIFDEPMQES